MPEVRWYIMAMNKLVRHRFGAWVASLLIAVFFLSQAFSCCMVNRQIGRFLAASWKSQTPMTASHSCCPNPPKDESRSEQDGSECRQGACCIQDGNQRVPQIVSEASAIPVVDLMVVHILAFVGIENLPLLAPASGSLAASGPPIYLATRRLLI